MKWLYLIYVAIRMMIVVFGIGGIVLFFVSPKFLGLTFISVTALATLKAGALVAGVVAAWLRSRNVTKVKFGGQ